MPVEEVRLLIEAFAYDVEAEDPEVNSNHERNKLNPLRAHLEGGLLALTDRGDINKVREVLDALSNSGSKNDQFYAGIMLPRLIRREQDEPEQDHLVGALYTWARIKNGYEGVSAAIAMQELLDKGELRPDIAAWVRERLSEEQ